MKFCALAFLLAALVFVECRNSFMGTNEGKSLLYHTHIQYDGLAFKKREENLYYTLPHSASNPNRVIQGILAYDVTHSAAVNVTQGGLGLNYVNLRFTSAVGRKIHYNVYIYV